MSKEWKSFLYSAFLFLVLPNALFVALVMALDLGRPLINLDYLIVSVLLAAGWRVTSYCALFLLALVDVLSMVGQVYPFIKVSDLLYLSRFIFLSSGVNQFYIISFFAIAFFSLLWFSISVPKEGKVTSLVYLNLGLFFYAVHVYGGDDRNKYWRVSDTPIVSSQFISFYEYRTSGFIGTFFMKGEAFLETGYQGGTQYWVKDVSILGDKVLLVVNESWGVLKDEAAQDEVVRPVTNLKDKFEVLLYSEIDFKGATVAGEMRELCGLTTLHFSFDHDDARLQECLPRQFSDAGYSTHAIHGAVGVMYGRFGWYPKVGFQTQTFFESRLWPRRCYSFPGACDVDIASVVRKKLVESDKSFVYWLTLNTHNFYDSRDIVIDVFDCERFALEAGSETCRNAKLQAQFFQTLADSLATSDLSGAEVIVVGDHEPPIFNQSERERYFEEGKVSLLRFKVR